MTTPGEAILARRRSMVLMAVLLSGILCGIGIAVAADLIFKGDTYVWCNEEQGVCLLGQVTDIVPYTKDMHGMPKAVP